MLGECRTLLSGIILQANYSDSWQWKLHPDEAYSIRGVYMLLATQEIHTSEAFSDLIWHT